MRYGGVIIAIVQIFVLSETGWTGPVDLHARVDQASASQPDESTRNKLFADGVIPSCTAKAEDLIKDITKTIEDTFTSTAVPQWTPSDFALLKNLALPPETQKHLDSLGRRQQRFVFSAPLGASATQTSTGSGPPINGNPLTHSLPPSTGSASTTTGSGTFQLSYTGILGADSLYVLGVGSQQFSLSLNPVMTVNNAFNALTSASQFNIAPLLVDLKSVGGGPLEMLFGRFNAPTLSFGPFGLIANTGGQAWSDFPNRPFVEGLLFQARMCLPMEVQIQGAGAHLTDAEYAYGLNANIRIGSVTVGADTVWNQINAAGTAAAGATNAMWHVYGPTGGALNPVTTNCPAVPNTGIQCAAAGNGWDTYAYGDVAKGIKINAEFAGWNDTVHSSNDTGYQANVSVAVTEEWNLKLGYLNYGVNFYPPYGAAQADGVFYPGNAKGITLHLEFDSTDNRWAIYGDYFTGNTVSNGQSLSGWGIGVSYAPDPTGPFRVAFTTAQPAISGVVQSIAYQLSVSYTIQP